MDSIDERIQDKAFEIYDSFVRISPLHIDSKRNESSKKQAINCVDNIIKTIAPLEPGIKHMETYFDEVGTVAFYEKVKLAIQKF